MIRLLIRLNVPLFIVALCALCILSNRSEAAEQIRTVMVVGNEICIKADNSGIITLTDDGFPKSLPVWSQDGLNIAFIEQTRSPELARLVVMNDVGHVISEISIKPYSPREVLSGMRFVEELEWLSANRIAVSGSVNPSTSEYNIVDLPSHKVIKEFFDDGARVAFSPDGLHYAFISGSPHFTPADERVPTLNVDDNSVFSATQKHATFADAPRWADDGLSVAILVRNTETGEQKIIVHHREATTSVISLPFFSNTLASVSWSGSDLIVVDTSMESIGWRLPDGAGPWMPTNGRVMAPNSVAKAKAKAKASKILLERAVQTVGGRDADFWCDNCELSVLPRRSSRNE